MTLDLFQLSIALGVAGATIALTAYQNLRAAAKRRHDDWIAPESDDARE